MANSGAPCPEGAALSVVGSMVLLGSTIATWFSVLVRYPTDESRVEYTIFGRAYGSLHDYTVLGRPFEVLIVLAGAVALLAILYGSVVVDRMAAVAKVLIASGALALAVVLLAWFTFETTDPLGNATGGDVQVKAGAILAALSGAGILAGGVLVRRELSPVGR
jgi:exosortase/archaeosortase